MDISSWHKVNHPVLVTDEQKGLFGPGHNSFCQAPDGSVWMIYHGNLVSGTGWQGRSVWIAPVTFEEDGTPEFGRPQFEVQFPQMP